VTRESGLWRFRVFGKKCGDAQGGGEDAAALSPDAQGGGGAHVEVCVRRRPGRRRGRRRELVERSGRRRSVRRSLCAATLREEERAPPRDRRTLREEEERPAKPIFSKSGDTQGGGEGAAASSRCGALREEERALRDQDPQGRRRGPRTCSYLP